jgi:hypothetical protein
LFEAEEKTLSCFNTSKTGRFRGVISCLIIQQIIPKIASETIQNPYSWYPPSDLSLGINKKQKVIIGV